MGMFSSFFGGGNTAPELRPPGPEEQAGLGQLVRRGEAATGLSEAQVAALLQLIGPETATQLQALSQLRALMGGQPFTSPTVEDAIRRRESEQRERVLRQLGPGGEVSTPGRDILARGATESGIFREQARGQELQNLLGVLGLLGPQGAQRAQVGFAEPSPGILRTTGVQERVGELSARSRIAEALIGAQGKFGMAGLEGLGELGGFLAGKIPWAKLFAAGLPAGGSSAGMLPFAAAPIPII